MKYNICNGPIQISTSIKVILENFLLVLTVFEIFTIKDSRPWKCRSKSWCTTFTVAPIDGKCPNSYLMAIVVFALSLIIYDIFVNQEKWKKIDFENEGQVQGVAKQDLHHSTRNVWIHIAQFFRILATREHTFTQKVAHTHCDRQGYDYR